MVALGDSLTFGYRMRDPYAMDPRIPYPTQLEVELKKKIREKQVLVINAGFNGDPTDGMIGRFSRVVAPESLTFSSSGEVSTTSALLGSRSMSWAT